MSCRHCGTVVEGVFETCRFCRLPPESLHFITIFVKNRGNLKEIERELGVSYPTVRGRLNAVLRELGFQEAREPEPAVSAEDRAAERRAILKRVDQGEISADQAAAELEALR